MVFSLGIDGLRSLPCCTLANPSPQAETLGELSGDNYHLHGWDHVGGDRPLRFVAIAASSCILSSGPCYAEFVLKRVTITLEEEDLRWARNQAAAKNLSVSKLVAVLARERQAEPNYWEAYCRWKA
jgi:hypothetical protein